MLQCINLMRSENNKDINFVFYVYVSDLGLTNEKLQ